MKRRAPIATPSYEEATRAETFLAIDPRAFPGGWMLPPSDTSQPDDEEVVDDIAVLEVFGPLAQRSWYNSYDCVAEDFDAALADPKIRAVVLRLSSPGGVLSGLFETVSYMRASKARAQKPVVAYADGNAYSAAYALATVADEIYLGPTGSVGSIGVVARILDLTEANKLEGVKVTVVTSGKYKAEGDPDVPTSPEAVARMKDQVTRLATHFAEVVGNARGMKSSTVLGQQAEVYMGMDAVEAGLADGVMSHHMMAVARASALAGAKSMKQIFSALGMKGEDLSEDVAATAIQELMTALGVSSVDAAMGAVKGLQEHESRSRELATELAGIRKERDLASRKALLDANASKLTTALRAWAETQPLDALEAFLSVAPEVPQLKDAPAEPTRLAAASPLVFDGKTWAQLKPMERAQLKTEHPDLYTAMRAQATK